MIPFGQGLYIITYLRQFSHDYSIAMMRTIISIIVLTLSIIVYPRDISGRWRCIDDLDRSWIYEFSDDGAFKFIPAKEETLNAVVAISGQYKVTDGILYLCAEQYLEKSIQRVVYDRKTRTWLISDTDENWKQLSERIESECEFSMNGDTIYIWQLPYVKVVL